MTADFSWLPEFVTLGQCGGDWTLYVNVVYGCFKYEFVDSHPSLFGKDVRIRWRPIHEEKPDTFWHLVSETTTGSERLPALRRCERIRWPRALIGAVGSSRVRTWADDSRGERRVYVATEDFSYFVVLADRGTYLLLITAFPVEYQRRRDQFRKEHDANTTN